MSKFRVLDGNAPGYNRAPIDSVGTSSQSTGPGTVGSPVLSEAYAVKYYGYTPTAGLPTYSRWRIIGAVATIHGGAVCNEIELYTGADGTGTKLTPSGSSSTNNYRPQDLINGLTAENQSPDFDYLYSALGSYYQVDLATPAVVKSIKFYQYLDVPESSWYRKYYIDMVHVEASNDGTTWIRVASSVDLTSPRNAMKIINL